jgi:hypothetical protein
MAGRLSLEIRVVRPRMPAQPNAIETSVIAAAHFMSRGLIKLQKRNKKILAWS